jgi:VWFA-related protein
MMKLWIAPLLAAVTLNSAQQRPVFRSGVELVRVDVSVVDDSGKPVEGLGPEHFELTVGGQPRRVVSAQFVSTRTTGEQLSVRSHHFTTNEHDSSGRLILLAVDQMHIRRVEGRAALRAAGEFIASLAPGDRVAAVPLTHAAAISFTSDHASVKRQLDKLSGTGGPPMNAYNIGLTEALAMSEGSRIVIEQIVRRECGQAGPRLLQGRPPNDLRRIAEGDVSGDSCPAQVELEGRTLAQQARSDARMSLNGLRTLIRNLGEIDGTKAVVLVSEGLVAEPQYFDLSDLGAEAHAARVTIYVLQLDTPLLDATDAKMSPTATADIRLRGDGLARLAGSARGALFTLVGSDPQPFRRILSELSGYYLLAFEPLPGDRDGGTHRLNVKARTSGAVVRARPAFQIPAPSARETTEAQLVRLLRDPRSATSIPVRATTYAQRQPEGEGMKIVVAVETPLQEPVTIGYVLVNRSKVIVASGAETSPDGRLLATAVVPSGSYMLKAAAIDAAGQSGSVERHFDARIAQAGIVRTGELMLAESPVGGGLQPLVASLRGNTLVGYLEIYAPENWSPDGVTVTLEVQNGDRTLPARVPAVVERGNAGRWTAIAKYPLADAQPGPHLAVVTLALPGSDPIRLSRPFAVERKK